MPVLNAACNTARMGHARFYDCTGTVKHHAQPKILHRHSARLCIPVLADFRPKFGSDTFSPALKSSDIPFCPHLVGSGGALPILYDLSFHGSASYQQPQCKRC
jgi:hypothetical protein